MRLLRWGLILSWSKVYDISWEWRASESMEHARCFVIMILLWRICIVPRVHWGRSRILFDTTRLARVLLVDGLNYPRSSGTQTYLIFLLSWWPDRDWEKWWSMCMWRWETKTVLKSTLKMSQSTRGVSHPNIFYFLIKKGLCMNCVLVEVVSPECQWYLLSIIRHTVDGDCLKLHGTRPKWDLIQSRARSCRARIGDA